MQREQAVIWVDWGVEAGKEWIAVYTHILSIPYIGTKEIFVYKLSMLPLCVCVC